MKKNKLSTVSFGLLTFLLFTSAATAETGCPAHFQGGVEPLIAGKNMLDKTTEVCFSEFVTLFSGVTRTPLYAAEELTAPRIAAARAQKRNDSEQSFHEEDHVPASHRSLLNDYKRSGFDRGHVAPNGDMSNAQSQGESFSLSNMIPQTATSNRGVWANVESVARELATRHGTVYVVTVPVFNGASTLWLKDRVAIPAYVAKAVYVPSTGVAGVYLVENDDDPQWRLISVDELMKMTQIDVFPELSTDIKKQEPSLPAPSRR